jgi:hypothetical protein
VTAHQPDYAITINLMTARSFARMLFAIDEPVDRRTYATVGFSLMALKYVVDATLIGVVAGVLWTPIDYLVPLITLTGPKIAQFPTALSVFLLSWTLPFIWIGVTMSVRRAVDAGIPAGVVVGFFVPFLNYVLMLGLAARPTARQEEWAAPLPSRSHVSKSASLAAVTAGVASGLAMLAVSALMLKSYGGMLFLGAPFLIGLVSALTLTEFEAAPTRRVLLVGQLALVATAGTFLLFALEGVLCLAMAAPLAVPITLLGSLAGAAMGKHGRPHAQTMALMLLAIAPFGSAIDAVMPAPSLRTVLTSIEVDAPPQTVWTHVVSFSDIESPPAWYFRTGLAYPLRARIDGSGPGAVRHCEFTTGAFVEPITVWDEPRTLAFDVIEQPRPLHELSPYAHVYAPHLDGFFRTTHGEFRLIALAGGRTRLEGRTWYSLNMQPALYWQSLADPILHRIHQRVLEHVKARAERR